MVSDPEGTPFDGTTPLDLTVRPAPLQPAPARTGFVSGIGQQGRVGMRLGLPLVFEVRDSANRPIAGRAVTLSGVNARLEGVAATTDSAGRVRAFVILGERAGAVSVTARVGTIERQAPLIAVAGPPSAVVLQCGGLPSGGQLLLAAGALYEFAVVVEDGFGNDVDVTDLAVASGDERVAHVTTSGGDRIALRAERAGTTNLTVQASGLRVTVAVVVPRAGGQITGCRRSAPRG